MQATKKMKKLLLIFIILFSYQFLFSKNDFKLKPILLDFHGITGKDSTIIAYGNYGSYLVSYDGDKTWTTKKVFDKGDIIKMFYEKDRIVAFQRDGLVAVSYDDAHTWEIVKDLGYRETYKYYQFLIKCGQILDYENGYVYRNMDSIYVFDKSFKKQIVLNINTPNIFIGFQNEYKLNTMAYDGSHFYFSYYDFNILKADKNFNIIDTINIRKVLNLPLDAKNRGNIYYNNNSFYFKIGHDFYKINNDFTNSDKINSETTLSQRQSNFNLDFFYNNEPYFSIQHLDMYYKLTNENKMKYAIYNNFKKAFWYDKATINVNANIYNYQTYQKDSIVYFVNQDNTIRKINMYNNNLPLDYEEISINIDSQVKDFELKKYDSLDKLLILDKEGDKYNSPISYLDLNTNLFNINMNYNNLQVDFANESLIQYHNTFNDILYEKDKSKYSIITQKQPISFSRMFYSDDEGQNFKYKDLNGSILLGFYDKNRIFTYIDNENSKYYIIESSSRKEGGLSVYFWLYENYDFIKEITFYNDDFINSKMADSLTYVVMSFNSELSGIQIKSTSNKGDSWEIYKEYPYLYYLTENKELTLNNKKIWVYSYFEDISSKYYIDVFDIESKKIYNIFEKVLTDAESFELDNICFDATKGKFYLSFFNTLMVSSNIFEDNIKWETFNYPNNGKVNKKFQIFDKTIFARYEDDKNEENVYWINGIEMIGDPTSIEIVENQIEYENHLYTFPPFPNPSNNDVRAKIYWDSRIDIDNSDIAVYDINGNKVSGKENLIVEKISDLNGYIKWNCVGQPKGTYLIKIQHGNNTKTVKVVVN